MRKIRTQSPGYQVRHHTDFEPMVQAIVCRYCPRQILPVYREFHRVRDYAAHIAAQHVGLPMPPPRERP